MWEIRVAGTNVIVKLIGRLDCGCLVSKPWGVLRGCLFFSPAKGACAGRGCEGAWTWNQTKNGLVGDFFNYFLLQTLLVKFSFFSNNMIRFL